MIRLLLGIVAITILAGMVLAQPLAYSFFEDDSHRKGLKTLDDDEDEVKECLHEILTKYTKHCDLDLD